jgi:hypothetical protein
MELLVGIWKAPIHYADCAVLGQLGVRVMWVRQERSELGDPDEPVDVVVCRDAAGVRAYEGARRHHDWPVPTAVIYPLARWVTRPEGQYVVGHVIRESRGSVEVVHTFSRLVRGSVESDLGLRAALVAVADREGGMLPLDKVSAVWSPEAP